MADERLAAAPASTPPARPVGTSSAGPSYDSDAFGVFAEQFARFMGTAKFLIYMTLFVLVWVAWNVLAPRTSGSTRSRSSS